MTKRTTGGWWEQLRKIASDRSLVHNHPCTQIPNDANIFGGERIRLNNLYTFFKGTHPDGRGMNDEKLERVAWALGHRLELVPDDAIMVSKQTLRDLRKKLAEANSVMSTMTPE